MLGTLAVSAQSDNAITVTNTFSCSMIISTKIMTTFFTTVTTHAVISSPDTIYTAVGGVLFFLIVMVVLGVVAGLLVRRVKHNVVTNQLSEMISKSSKRGRFQECIAIECAIATQSQPGKGNTVHTNSIQYHHNFLLSTESDTMKLQPSDCQRNPAYGRFGPTDSSPAALSYSENPAYNIDAHPSAPQESIYEVIPSEIGRIPQEAQSVTCSQNPAYIHLGVHVEESFRAAADATSPGDYSQNPAYGIHSNPN